LAALGFAAGMVVDNAIVVVENIFTHMQQVKLDCKRLGGVILAHGKCCHSLVVEGEVAQLFCRYVSTITAAAVLSMFASLTLVPMLSGCFLNQAEHSRCSRQK